MMNSRCAERQSMIVTHSEQRGSGLIRKYGYHSAFSSQLSARVTDWLVPPPQKRSVSAVYGRYCPTASPRPRENPSRARQWTLPLSTTSPARATRSRRSQLHRGEPRRLSSKGPARDLQRLPYRMVPRRSVSHQRGPTPSRAGAPGDCSTCRDYEVERRTLDGYGRDRPNQNLCRRSRGDRAIEVPRKLSPSGEVHAARGGVARLAELVGVTQPAGYAR